MFFKFEFLKIFKGKKRILDEEWKELANQALAEINRLNSIDAWPSPKPPIKTKIESFAPPYVSFINFCEFIYFAKFLYFFIFDNILKNPKNYLFNDDCFPSNDTNEISADNKMNDDYEGPYLHKPENENLKNGGLEEGKEVSAPPKNKLDFKKNLSLQIAPKKGRSSSATLKNYPIATKKPSDDTLAIDEEDDTSHLEETGFVTKSKIIGTISKWSSETDIKKMKKNRMGLYLKLEISKNLKKKENLPFADLIGIKKDPKHYYFREKMVKENEVCFFELNGKKAQVGFQDDMKLKNPNSGSIQLKLRRKSKDDLDFSKISVQFLQNP